MVKIPDVNCVKNFWQKVTVCMFSLIYICLDFHEKYVFHVLVIQYFCQWLHYDNLWKIWTY